MLGEFCQALRFSSFLILLDLLLPRLLFGQYTVTCFLLGSGDRILTRLFTSLRFCFRSQLSFRVGFEFRVGFCFQASAFSIFRGYD